MSDISISSAPMTKAARPAFVGPVLSLVLGLATLGGVAPIPSAHAQEIGQLSAPAQSDPDVPLSVKDASAPVREAIAAFEAGDVEKAAQIATKAAQAGDPQAQVLIGTMYQDGLGVEQDYQKAASWYQKAVAQNDPSILEKT